MTRQKLASTWKGLRELFDRYFSLGNLEEPETGIFNLFGFKLEKKGGENEDEDY